MRWLFRVACPFFFSPFNDAWVDFRSIKKIMGVPDFDAGREVEHAALFPSDATHPSSESIFLSSGPLTDHD